MQFASIFHSCKNNEPNSVTSQPNPTKPKEWVEVYKFSGNGMKKSPSFELTGGEAKLKYSYQGEEGIGMFAAYVVDDGEDIMKVGGIPEIMTSSPKEVSESSIQKGAGKYYLNINAVGYWTVIIEELR